MRLNAVLLAAVVLTATPASLIGQASFTEPPTTNPNWEAAFPPFRMVGNLYYVGTHTLASYLISTDDGLILINTGVASSVPMIQDSIRALGFDVADVRILLATHGHWDHVAGLAAFKRLTGAQVAVHEAEVSLLESGGSTDFHFGGQGAMFEAVEVDRALRHGDVVRLGQTEITVHHHPGHTPGSASFSFVVREGNRDYNVLIANMAAVNDGVSLLDSPGYPSIARDFDLTFERQRSLSPDIWMASHAGQFQLHDKYVAGDAYDPTRFVDPDGYRTAVQLYEGRYRDQLAQEQRAR